MNVSNRFAPAAALPAAVLAFLIAVAAGSLARVGVAHAVPADEDIGVWTASVSASYENPDTGQIADSGGESGKTLGQSMVEGVTQPYALVEKDGSGETLVTVRFYEASELGKVSVSYDTGHAGAFSEPVSARKVGEDADANMADFQFGVPSEQATLRFGMYVEPMGRDVVFFATLRDLVEGNTAGFAQTIDVEALRAAAAAAEEEAQAAEAAEERASEPESAANKQEPAQDGPDVGLIVVGVVVAAVVVAVVALLVTRGRKKE